jgi:hypothetical protein
MDRLQKDLRGHAQWAHGQTLAEEEIAGGKLGYREYGKLDLDLVEEMACLVQERYHIAVAVVSACITDLEMAAEADGYNDRMTA